MSGFLKRTASSDVVRRIPAGVPIWQVGAGGAAPV